jgi:hypothetical protein
MVCHRLWIIFAFLEVLFIPFTAAVIIIVSLVSPFSQCRIVHLFVVYALFVQYHGKGSQIVLFIMYFFVWFHIK